MRREVLRMENVTCQESGITFLENFTLNIFEGEIMGLLPVDDHGLPAFLELLQLNRPLADGYIYYNERIINSWRHSNMNPNRICVISDQSRLVDALTVADNIFVLRPNCKTYLMRTQLFCQQLQPFLDDIEMNIPADCVVENLSLFERIVVEILKGIVGGNQLIVLSEISSLISDAELSKLHAIMRHYTAQGTSFLYINPHFEEIIQICDNAALMVNGHIEKIIRKKDMRIDWLLEYTQEYDHLVRLGLARRRKRIKTDQPLFSLVSDSPDFLGGLSFSLESGECLVIQSLNMRIDEDLIDAYSGEVLSPPCHFFLDGIEIDIKRNRNIAVLQENPTRSMLFPELSTFDNLCFTLDHRVPSVWLNKNIQQNLVAEVSSQFEKDLFQMEIEDMSERQKIQLIYQRILLQKPRLLVCIQPFKGEDLEHRMLIWELLNKILAADIAVLIFALNLADTLSLADRLIRVDSNNLMIEYTQKDFANIPIIAPWLNLFKNE